MKWLTLPSPFPEITSVLGGQFGEFNYVMSFNRKTQRWTASTKKTATHEPLIQLGTFETRAQCEAACARHQHQSMQ